MTTYKWSQSLSVSIDEHYDHSLKRIALIAFSILTYVISLVLNILFVSESSLFGLKVFPSGIKYIFQEYQTNLTPSNLIVFIWILIFTWQLLWLAYGITTIFRKSSSDYLYKYPPVMHWLIYLNFSLSNILYFLCLVFWSHKMFMFSACYSLLAFIGLYIGIFTSLFKLSDYQREMYYTEKTKDVWSIRLLVQNGLLLYASWSFIIFLITLDLSLVYEFNFSAETSHTIILIIILLKILLYFLIENVLAYNYCKFLFSPWILFFIYILDTLITQTLVKRKLKYYEHIRPIEMEYLEESFSYRKINFNLYLHTCLLAFYLFLFIAKLVKFIWKELCYQRRFTHNF